MASKSASKFGRLSIGLMVAASTMMGAFSFAAIGATGAAAQSMGDAHVRVIHASPDAPAVDIYVNDGKAFSNLAFKEVSAWANLPGGSYDVKVTAAGQKDAVISAKLTLEGGKYYSVVAIGKLANITAKVVEDNVTGLDAGKARLRVVHASPDAPAVDVAVKGGAVLVPNLAFPTASDYLTVDPMTVDVEVRAAGTTTVALAVPGLKLEAGKIYTVYAVGLLSGTPALTVLPVVDNAVGVASTNPSGGTTMPEAPASTGMPQTGAADSLFTLALLAGALLALATTASGVAIRVRNR